MEVLPVDVTQLVAVAMGCLMVLIPVAGFTARFAIKPITEAMAKMREGSTSKEAMAMLERRTALLEQEVQHLGEMRQDLSRVLEEVEFQRKLTAPPSAERTS